MELQRSLELFIREKQAINISESTISTYRTHCSGFIIFCKEHGQNEVKDACTEVNYYEYICFLTEKKKIKDVTVASYMRSVKAWFNWMMEKGWTASFFMHIPKYQETLRETYTDQELTTLLRRPGTGCTEVEYITWIMINVLIATGIRLSSLKAMKVRDFSYNDLLLRINTTKNNLPIPLPINPELALILIDYLARMHLQPDDYMFATGYGTPYSSRTIQDYVEQYLIKRQIIKARKVHAFRHTFAKKYYLTTHDVYKLKEILGHKSLSMTEHYLLSLGCALTETIEYNPQKEHADVNADVCLPKRRGHIYFEDLNLYDEKTTF